MEDNNYLFTEAVMRNSSSGNLEAQCFVYVKNNNGIWEYNTTVKLNRIKYDSDFHGNSISAHSGTLLITVPGVYYKIDPTIARNVYIYDIKANFTMTRKDNN